MTQNPAQNSRDEQQEQVTRLVRADEVKIPEIHAWQFINLEQDAKKQEQEIRSEVYKKIQQELEPQISKQTAILKREAYEEAKQAGFEEGYQAGFETGQAQGIEKAEQSALVELAPKIEKLESILNDLVQPQAYIQEQVFQQVSAIAIKLAERIVEEAIQLDPHKLIHFIEQAVALLPEDEAKIEVELHPDDLNLVSYYQQQHSIHWLLKPNQKLVPGSCRVKKLNSVINHNWKDRLQELMVKTEHIVASMTDEVDADSAQSTDDESINPANSSESSTASL